MRALENVPCTPERSAPLCPPAACLSQFPYLGTGPPVAARTSVGRDMVRRGISIGHRFIRAMVRLRVTNREVRTSLVRMAK